MFLYPACKWLKTCVDLNSTEINFIFTASILTVFPAHDSEKTDENWTEQRLGLLNFNYGFAQKLAQDSPKQAKNEIIREIFSLCHCLPWDFPVSLWDHEIELKTVNLTTKSWDLRGLYFTRQRKTSLSLLG